MAQQGQGGGGGGGYDIGLALSTASSATSGGQITHGNKTIYAGGTGAQQYLVPGIIGTVAIVGLLILTR